MRDFESSFAWLGTLPIIATLNERPVDPQHAGRYLVFERLKPGDVITLHFRVPRTTGKYTIDDKGYTISSRGSTVIDIEPRDLSRHSYPLYLRERMNSGEAPMRKVRRFVTDRLIETQVF